MDASETFKALQISKRRAALTRFSAFVFLNLLERDAQFFAKLLLAHTEREPLLAHPSADVSVDGTCTFRREFFSFALFTVLFTSDDLEIAITLNGDVARLVGMYRKFSLGHKDPVFAWTSSKKPS